MKKYNIIKSHGIDNYNHLNWPVVYILECDEGIYIGETNEFYERIKSHQKKWNIKNKWIISHEQGNSSVTYMIESYLINFAYAELENSKIDFLNLKMQKKQIWTGSNFFEKSEFKKDISEIWNKFKKFGLFKNDAKYIINSEAYRYSPLKSLNEEQVALLENLNENILNNINSFIKGSAGTGKTLLTLHLGIMASKNEKNIKIGLFSAKSGKSDLFKKRINKLSNNSFIDVKIIDTLNEENLREIDHLIIDEGQLLRKYYFDAVRAPKHFEQGLFDSDLSFIESLNIKYTIFYDELQSVERYSINTDSEFNLNRGQTFKIEKQHRIETKVNFMDFLDAFFIRRRYRTKHEESFDFSDYDIKSFQNENDLYKYVKEKDREMGMSRLISSISTQKWISKDNKDKFDFKLDDCDLKWNSTMKNWVENENVNSVGSIYSIHGSDLSYAGVIFGSEIKMENNEIKIDSKFYQRFKGGQVFKELDEEEKFNKILNVYQVLLTRGSKGLGVYIPDPALRKHFENLINQKNSN